MRAQFHWGLFIYNFHGFVFCFYNQQNFHQTFKATSTLQRFGEFLILLSFVTVVDMTEIGQINERRIYSFCDQNMFFLPQISWNVQHPKKRQLSCLFQRCYPSINQPFLKIRKGNMQKLISMCKPILRMMHPTSNRWMLGKMSHVGRNVMCCVGETLHVG